MPPTKKPPFSHPLSSCLLGMAVWGLLFGVGVVPLLGTVASDDPLTRTVLSVRGVEAARYFARLAWLHLAVGAVIGLLVAAPGALLARPAEGRGRRLLRLFALNAAATLAITVHGIVDRPIFFDDVLNLKGGLLAAFQHTLTDNASPTGVIIVSLGLLAILLVASGPARRRLFSRWALAALPLLGLLAVLVWWQERYPHAAAPSSGRPNILIVAFDSLRSDRLGVEGYARRVTPNIDSVARRGVRFTEAYVPLARTLQSWASLLTATYPHTHGLREMFPNRDHRTMRLPTLPQRLAALGYRSFVVTDYAGEAFSLVDLGYDITDAPPASSIDIVVQREIIGYFPFLVPALNNELGHRILTVLRYLTTNPHGEMLTRHALAHIDRAAGEGRPFFATVFYSACHIPYSGRYPGYRLFTSPTYRGPNKYGFSVRDIRTVADAEKKLDPEEVEQVRALYDGAAAVADAEFGDLLDGLRERGLLENTIVVVTADHGEHLYEHGNAVDHGKWFRGGDAVNRVPLVFAGPGVPDEGQRIPHLVRSIDIAPTLMSLIGAPIERREIEGVDLTPLMHDPSRDPQLTVFAETGLWLSAPTMFAGEPDALIYPSITDILTVDPEDQVLVLRRELADLTVTAKHRMLRRGRHKLVYEPTVEGARWHLFDVVADPGNEHDLAKSERALLAELKAQLLDWMRRDPARTIDAKEHVVRQLTYAE
ncbi:MAG: sulfatase [Planctomycetota bacterium]